MFSLVAAEQIGTYKLDEPMQISNYCQVGTCTYTNIISVEYPNSTIEFLNTAMTQNGQLFTYNFTPDQTGDYTFKSCGNPDGKAICDSDTFEVTDDGDPLPSTGLIIFFSLLFIVIVGTMLTLLFNTIFRMISWDFDARDLIFNISSYFIIFVTYILSKNYFGNAFVNEFLVWLIGVCALTSVILPLIAFFMSIFRGNLKQNE